MAIITFEGDDTGSNRNRLYWNDLQNEIFLVADLARGSDSYG